MHFAINVVSHCNLRCNFCNHHAPFMPKQEMQPGEYLQHFEQIARRCGRIQSVRLSGGEPFLHSDLTGFVKAIRPHTPTLVATSNMTWLKSSEELKNHEEVFRNLDLFYASIYRGNDQQLRLIQTIHQFGVNVVIRRMRTFISFRFLHQPETVTDLCDQQNMTNLLPDGKLARCPVAAYGHKHPKVTEGFLSAREKDGFFDLHSGQEFAAWKNKWPFEACRYCTMWKKQNVPWHQSKTNDLKLL